MSNNLEAVNEKKAVSDPVYLEKAGEIAYVCFNRPEKRNALSYDIWTKIPDLIAECESDSTVKVIILKGTGSAAFSAGADISEFKTLRYTAEGAEKYNEATMVAEKAIMKSSKPTIAMIQGFCVGGGCEIAVACDFRFSDENGKFGITPAKLGLVYNTPGTKNVVDLVGPAKAKDILFTGRLLDAEEAYRIGLIDRIIPAVSIKEETLAYAELICKNAQQSVRGSKKIINDVLSGAEEDSPEAAKLVIESFLSDDYKEGVHSFLEKRKPNFKYS
ncbi:enoyl-CoA hydratase/isomerase family protein [Bacillus sp. CMF12]|jgi:enoyl-CoA hydratase|uniref:enoyl-CoA hydratase-related protein n=1 Tax=Bacillaceae TaxID=186817 RepID=UPI001FB27439|nr:MULTISPECIES: enoyl-CoA hydratase-related protein [Bacillaceae]MDF2035841.1 enoyl-CoA hydratase-related protein [Cytobacillus oceanisediminis]UOE53144.1 enoyl-CoA hydratase/isomerase family protein [Cytobacillus oceanisediminis]USK52354.1 enoyl-CoA hydratase/isomerase family protein [Bacillus sp. CMF12]